MSQLHSWTHTLAHDIIAIIQSLQQKSQTKRTKMRTNKKVSMQSVHFGVSNAEWRDKLLMGAKTNAPKNHVHNVGSCRDEFVLGMCRTISHQLGRESVHMCLCGSNSALSDDCNATRLKNPTSIGIEMNCRFVRAYVSSANRYYEIF